MKDFKKIIVLAVASTGISKTADWIAPRPETTNPTAKRLAVVAGAAVTLEFVSAFAERKLHKIASS